MVAVALETRRPITTLLKLFKAPTLKRPLASQALLPQLLLLLSLHLGQAQPQLQEPNLLPGRAPTTRHVPRAAVASNPENAPVQLSHKSVMAAVALETPHPTTTLLKLSKAPTLKRPLASQALLQLLLLPPPQLLHPQLAQPQEPNSSPELALMTQPALQAAVASSLGSALVP